MPVTGGVVAAVPSGGELVHVFDGSQDGVVVYAVDDVTGSDQGAANTGVWLAAVSLSSSKVTLSRMYAQSR
jgi:hypothetical protein